MPQQKIMHNVCVLLTVKPGCERVYSAAQAFASVVISNRLIAASPYLLNFISTKPEDVDIVVANSALHFNICAASSADCKRAVYHKLHAAGAACFLSGKRNLLRYVGSRHQNLGCADFIILDEYDAHALTQAGVMLKLL